MFANFTHLSHCALVSKNHKTISIYDGVVIDNERFNADVSKLASSLIKLKAKQFALYYEQAYPFCVCLFALLHADKKVWVTANNKEATAEKLIDQGCLLLGEWSGKEYVITANESSELKLEPLNINKEQLLIYTSGSSGQAKAIAKSLQQFQSEIEVLEKVWGQHLGQSEVFATVSHQHIYGLLFRIFWPLVAGRCFHSEMYLSPEPLLKAANQLSAYWVASPAQLKRLDELSPWQEIEKLTAIFSSGGPLPKQAATQIYKNCGHKVLEVYGSSETGGIAWREQVDNALWTVFDGISITQDKEGGSHLSSPYLADSNAYIMDDKIKLVGQQQFELLGRVDRIVKVEEKRLSLDELELHLNSFEWIEQSTTILLEDKRDKLAAVLELTEAGHKNLQQLGRAEFIKQIRKQLMHGFETVVLPRKWLFMQSLPLTAQGKINRELLLQLFSLDPLRFPQIHLCDYQQESVELQCRVPPSLLYFSGHFPEQPILPGATQLFWVEQMGKIFFNITLPFLRMEVIKFKKIIRPGDIIQMKLNWKTSNSKLYFELSSVNDSHSSGRMVYGEQE